MRYSSEVLVILASSPWPPIRKTITISMERRWTRYPRWAARMPKTSPGRGSGWGDVKLSPLTAAFDSLAEAAGERCGTRRARPRTRVLTNNGVMGGWVQAAAAQAWNKGVGEHVRTRFHSGKERRVKLRTRDPHRSKKTCFFCRTGFRYSARLFESSIRPFDLMSRRHPLCRLELSDFTSALWEQIECSCDVPASSRRQFSQTRFTSSSWRPYGSSSQSSSLRSSPSLTS